MDDDGEIAWGHNDPSQPSNLLLGAPNMPEVTGAAYVPGYVDKVVTEEYAGSLHEFSPFEGVQHARIGILFNGEVFSYGHHILYKNVRLSDQMKINVGAGVPVNLRFYVRSTQTITTGQYSWAVRRRASNLLSAGSTTIAGTNPGTITANTWTPFMVTFTPGSGDHWLEIRFTAATNINNIEIMNPSVTITGFQTIYTPSSSLAGYEDITNFVTGVNWSLGTQDVTDRISQDAQMEVQLSDPDRWFVPGSPNSPIGSVLTTQHRIALQMRHNTGQWRNMWVGNITEVIPVSSSNREKTCKIIATLEVYAAKNTEVRLEKTADLNNEKTIQEVLIELFNQNAVSTANLTTGWRLGTSKLGLNTFLNGSTIEFILSSFDPHIWEHAWHGAGELSDGVGFNEVLDGLMWLMPSAWLLVSRNGVIQFYDIAHTPPGGGELINIDNRAIEAEYCFGKQLINQVTFKYNPYRTGVCIVLPEPRIDDEDFDGDDPLLIDIYWGKKKNIIYTDRKRFKKEIKRVAMPYFNVLPPFGIDYFTDLANDTYGLGSVPGDYLYYDYDPDKVRFLSFFNFGNTSIADNPQESIALHATSDGGFYTRINASGFYEIQVKQDKFLRVRFTNAGQLTTNNTYTVDLYAVKGVAQVIEDETEYRWTSNESIAANRKVSAVKVNHVPFLSLNGSGRNPDQAGWDVGKWARNIINYFSVPRAMYESMSISTNDMFSDDFTLIQNYTLGSIILLDSMEMSNQTHHMIVGEEGRIEEGVLTMRYTLTVRNNDNTWLS